MYFAEARHTQRLHDCTYPTGGRDGLGESTGGIDGLGESHEQGILAFAASGPVSEALASRVRGLSASLYETHPELFPWDGRYADIGKPRPAVYDPMPTKELPIFIHHTAGQGFGSLVDGAGRLNSWTATLRA